MYRSTLERVIRLLAVVMLALALPGLANAFDLSPEARRQLATYRDGLGKMATHGGLADLLGIKAFGEGGQLLTGEQLRSNINQRVLAERGQAGPLFGVGGQGASGGGGRSGGPGVGAGGVPPGGRPVPEAPGSPEGPGGEERLSTSQKLRGHLVGFGQFSGILLAYVGPQLLAEVERGEMTMDQFGHEMRKLVLSPEAIGGYLHFVGFHELGERALHAGSSWGTKIPQLRGFMRVADQIAKPRSIRRMMLKQGILLTAVITGVEISHHWWHRMKKRPWENGNPEAGRMQDMSTVGSFLYSLRQRDNLLPTLGHAFEAFLQAFTDVDWVGVIVSSAAFMAGTAIGILTGIPGWGQLAIGLILADLAHRYLVPWIHREISSRWKRNGAAAELRLTYVQVVGFGRSHQALPAGQITSAELSRRRRLVTEAVAELEVDLPEAFDGELAPLNEELQKKYQQLEWASRGKLTTDLTNQMTHAMWFVRRTNAGQTRSISAVVRDAAEQAFAAAESYSGRAGEQGRAIVGAFRLQWQNTERMRQLWENYDQALDRASEAEMFQTVAPSYEKQMIEELRKHTGNSKIRNDGGAKLITLASRRRMSLELIERDVQRQESELEDFSRKADATAYRAARTRAQEIRAELAKMDLPRLLRDAKPHVREPQYYGGGYGGGGAQVDELRYQVSTIERFVGARRERYQERSSDVRRRQQSVQRLDQRRDELASQALERIEAKVRAGENFSTYTPLLAALTARGQVPRDHVLIRHAVRGISTLRERNPSQRKELYARYRTLIGAMATRYPSLIPQEWLKEMKDLGVPATLPSAVTPEAANNLPAFANPVNQFPWPTGDAEPRSEQEWAFSTMFRMENLETTLERERPRLDAREQELDLYRQQNQGWLGNGGQSYDLAEHVTRSRAKKAAGLIDELRAAEQVMEELGYLERQGVPGLDRPAWMVPDYDKEIDQHDELAGRTRRQDEKLNQYTEEYWDLFYESLDVLQEVYSREPRPLPRPNLPQAFQGQDTPAVSDEEMRQLMEWIRKGQGERGSASATPAPSSGGLFGIGGAPAAQPTPRPDLSAMSQMPDWWVADDHQAYQPLLSMLVSLEGERVHMFLRDKEKKLTPKRRPEEVYKKQVYRLRPGLELQRPRMIDTRICHQGNRNCDPGPDLSALLSPEARARRHQEEMLERREEQREEQLLDAEEAWFRSPPQAVADARTRWHGMRDLLRSLDSLESVYTRDTQALAPLNRRLYPEYNRPSTPVPPTIR